MKSMLRPSHNCSIRKVILSISTSSKRPSKQIHFHDDRFNIRKLDEHSFVEGRYLHNKTYYYKMLPLVGN